MSWAERSTGISPTTTDSCFAHMFGRVDSIDADIARIDEQIGARLAPFMWKTILNTRVLIAEDLGRSADTPGARAGAVLHQKKRSQPTPVAVARCGNQHVGGGCCASSRSIP